MANKGESVTVKRALSVSVLALESLAEADPDPALAADFRDCAAALVALNTRLDCLGLAGLPLREPSPIPRRNGRKAGQLSLFD